MNDVRKDHAVPLTDSSDCAARLAAESRPAEGSALHRLEAVALVQAAATLPVVLLAIPAVLLALLVGASALALVGFAAHRVKLPQGDADLVLRPIDK